MKVITIILEVLKTILQWVWGFFKRHWEDFLINLAASAAVAVLLIYLLRVPEFEITFDSSINAEGKTVLTVVVNNEKYFIDFAQNTVTAHFWIPSDIIQGKTLFVNTQEGNQQATFDFLEGELIEHVGGRKYTHISELVPLPFYQRSATRVLSIVGNFEPGVIKVCGLFKTPFGEYPRVEHPVIGKFQIENINELSCGEYVFPK